MSDKIKVGDLVRRKSNGKPFNEPFYPRMALVYKVEKIPSDDFSDKKIYYIEQETGEKDWHYESLLDNCWKNIEF